MEVAFVVDPASEDLLPGRSEKSVKIGAAPFFSRPESAAYDLRANIPADSNLTIPPHGHAKVDTGTRLAIPTGFVALVCPRSGLALKHGIAVLNSPGIIDPGYRGTIGVVLANFGMEPFVVSRGMRIAQLLFQPYSVVTWHRVPSLDETVRNKGGFGSTGE